MTVAELIAELEKHPKDILVLTIPSHRYGFIKVHAVDLVNKIKTSSGGANYEVDQDNELMVGESAIIVY